MMLNIAEQQLLKELKKSSININGYNFGFDYELNEKGSYQLTVRLKDKTSKLLPHIEPGQVVCYDVTDRRYISTSKEIKDIRKSIRKIVDGWKDVNSSRDIINSELNLYFRGSFSKTVFINVDTILNKTKINGVTKINIDERDTLIKIDAFKNGDKNSANCRIYDINIEQIIDNGYKSLEELRDFFIAHFNIHEKKEKISIININSERSRSTFYINQKQNIATFARDSSFASFDNSRFRKTEELYNSNILVIGAGAIGSHFIEQIASFWPSKIYLYDKDIVEKDSSIRQNYVSNYELISKTSVMKFNLEKFNGVKVETGDEFTESKYDDLIGEDIDYIFDLTGEGIFGRHFKFFKTNFPNSTVATSFIIDKYTFVKIQSLQTINNFETSNYRLFDIKANKKYSNDENNKIIKGCDPILEYSYLNVYKASNSLAIDLIKYIRRGKKKFYGKKYKGIK